MKGDTHNLFLHLPRLNFDLSFMFLHLFHHLSLPTLCTRLFSVLRLRCAQIPLKTMTNERQYLIVKLTAWS